MSDPHSKSFEEQIAAATSAEEIRQLCINHDGRLTQDRDGTIHVAAPVAAPAVPTAPASRADHLQERVIYPHGNSRIVITATSQVELDETEARVRAAFAGQQ